MLFRLRLMFLVVKYSSIDKLVMLTEIFGNLVFLVYEDIETMIKLNVRTRDTHFKNTVWVHTTLA